MSQGRDTELDRFFASVGGVPLMQGNDPETVWNFGMRGPGGLVTRFDQMSPLIGLSVHAVAPGIAGRWDGKTNVSNWLSTQKVLGGKFLPAQAQKIGSCGGAATSGGLNVLQCNQIASGRRNDTFKTVSRAWCYVGAREMTGIRGGGDGVIAPSPLEWCKAKGVVNQEESGDTNYDSDQVSLAWDRRGIPKDMMEAGQDNLIAEMAPCYNFQEAADVISSGGVVMVASDQGFTMQRDRYGVCQPRGVWQHYMYFAAVLTLPDGRRVLGCGQSWGQNVPGGPTLDGCPDYVFGVEERVVNRMLGQRVSTAVTTFAGWAAPDLPWIFM